jgi:predicted Zn-dependent peptidase
MKKVTLDNGLTILYKNKPGKAVVVELMVNVGSNHEKPAERGISHFLEHMLFEGTTKRPTSHIITNEIEKIGGDFNAYTTNERTCFYIKVLKKDFKKAVEILADIMQNSLFKQEHLTRERNVVLKEIDMVYDEPRYYQWILLQQTLYKKHPCRYPTYGDRKVIENLTRDQVLAYFNKHYISQNMVLTIVGDVNGWLNEAKKQFVMSKGKKPASYDSSEPKTTKTITKKTKKDIANTYCTIGFKTVPRTNRHSYVLDVINGILGRGQSGKMFAEIRSKRGLAYDVGTQHVSEISYGYFAVYASIDKKNVAKAKKVMLEELAKLKNVSDEDIKDSKTYIEGDYLLELEDVQKIADQVSFWQQLHDIKLMDKYIQNMKSVTSADIKRVVKKYFVNPTMVVLEGK